MRATHKMAVLQASVLLVSVADFVRAASLYEEDVRFALEAIEKECGHFFELKKIDWEAVGKEFLEEAKSVETDQEHLVLLWRLLARLKDGHAAVLAREKTEDVRWPDQVEKTGPGMFWCRVGNRIYVKNSWSAAREARIEPGMEVIEVDGVPVVEWLQKRIACVTLAAVDRGLWTENGSLQWQP